MKVLMLSLDDYPHCGGKSTHMSSLIDGLKSLNIDTDVVSRSNLSQSKINLKKASIYINKFTNPKKYFYLRKKIEFDLYFELLKGIQNIDDYDCISCQDALACTAIGRLYKDKKITLTMHTYFGLEYTLDNKILNENDEYYKKLFALEIESLKYANNVVAVDDRIYDHVKKMSNEYETNNKIYSIINFTNTDLYNTEKDEHANFNIMCVRRLVEKNGVVYAAKAMKHIGDNIFLHIYGEGPELDTIKKIVEDEELEKKVFLHGKIDNSMLPEVYRKCDVVLVPSITVNGLQEATSISAIEAMSCGIPVIASKIGGLAQMINNDVNGILVQEKNEIEIAEKIIYLYNNPEIRNKISKNAREYVLKNHSHICAAKQYLDIFMS